MTSSTTIPDPAAPVWDERPPPRRRDALVALADAQLSFLLEHAPFFRTREDVYRIGGIDRIEDLEEIPIQGADTVRRADPNALVPDPLGVAYSHGTGGTTGPSLDVLDTAESWATSVSRMANVVGDLEGTIAFNTYNGTHITSPLLNDVVRACGGTVRNRALTDSPADMIGRMRDHGCTLLIAPGSTPSQDKGGSVEDLLAADGGEALLDELDRVWYSSTHIDEEIRALLQEYGIVVESFFGNTETRAIGYAPDEHPHVPHVLEGQYLVNGVDRSGAVRRTGEDLRLVVSAIASSADGEHSPHRGTAFFRSPTGDAVDEITPPGKCPHSEACPFTTRTLVGIERVERIREKELSGCQVL